MLQLLLAVLALTVAAEGSSTLIAELKELVELREAGHLTPSEFTAAKARIVGSDGAADAENYKAMLTDVVTDIMLGDTMTKVLTNIAHRGSEQRRAASRRTAEAAEAADERAAASANMGTATASGARTTIWIADEHGGLAIGAAADVSLRKAAGAHGGGLHGLYANANFTVEGEVVARGREVAASLDRLDARVAALDAVAVKSSSAGAQRLGSVTADALALAGGLQLGARVASTPCGPGDAGTLMWNTEGEGAVNVCDGKGQWKPIYEPSRDGSTIGRAGKTCKTIKDLGLPGTDNGVYWIKPDPGRDALEATCEMTNSNDGGGWTLLYALPKNGQPVKLLQNTVRSIECDHTPMGPDPHSR